MGAYIVQCRGHSSRADIVGVFGCPGYEDGVCVVRGYVSKHLVWSKRGEEKTRTAVGV
jgi:hypothetical protein